MSNRPTTLTFDQKPDFFPAGLPLEPWEVVSDANFNYEVEANGRLVRKDRSNGSRWVSSEFTGNFSATVLPRYALTKHVFMLYVVCGFVKSMQQVEIDGVPTPLLSLPWPWVLEAFEVDREAVDLTKTYKGCIQLLQEAERDPGYKSGNPCIDAMIGMALCRPALLQGKSARNALQCLEDFQLRAIVGWPKVHLSD
jgi:hypothetical protein